ncbi:Transposase IS200 like protein [Rubripirellula amarantea]|uniref:Transposase IS200 like protein n=1 Tax=Rubripirellula amarantea TaxID=2527999 RepID=A0A5C5WMC6_9BACT|nr:transposase [Rubripirellula amarantea]TWT50952.1 Transposase IS200 like protein [Rubripirellula amarantea]
MPRQSRDDRAGQIYHALNRGNQRQEIFHKPEDYEGFIRVLAEGLQKYPLELFSFTLMPNHWHLVLRPAKDGQMGRLLRWVTATHTLRYRGHYHNRGDGHLYQGRFKSFPIDDDEHFYVVCRYVERNPLRAKLVNSAKDWPHGSLYRWNKSFEPDPKLLSPWPIRRLPRWNERVDQALTAGELKELRTCVGRSRPYGSEEWVEQVAERYGLWHTLRPAGRPRKRQKSKATAK